MLGNAIAEKVANCVHHRKGVACSYCLSADLVGVTLSGVQDSS